MNSADVTSECRFYQHAACLNPYTINRRCLIRDPEKQKGCIAFTRRAPEGT